MAGGIPFVLSVERAGSRAIGWEDMNVEGRGKEDGGKWKRWEGESRG